jgi:threo-3-hydroxy-L-aspartate ammonia-lyase
VAAPLLPVTLDDVEAAARRLQGVAVETPLLRLPLGDDLFVKPESLQRTGSFKFRGAYNAVHALDPAVRAHGVATFSSGNHAQGVALAANLHGVPAAIVMPDDAPAVKAEATLGYGAEVISFSRATGDGEELQREVAAERGMTVVHAYEDPPIMAGQGTAVRELLEDVPDLDAIVAPVGGGGLLAGTAIAARALNPNIRLFAVETVGADDTAQSFRRGERVSIPQPTTIADGIRLRTPGERTFAIVQSHVDDVLVVSDEAVLDTLRFIIQRMKIVAEPTGAVALTAVLAGRVPDRYRRVGVFVTGGNIDPTLLGRLWG